MRWCTAEADACQAGLAAGMGGTSLWGGRMSFAWPERQLVLVLWAPDVVSHTVQALRRRRGRCSSCSCLTSVYAQPFTMLPVQQLSQHCCWPAHLYGMMPLLSTNTSASSSAAAGSHSR
jgi:hypothetical protein